MISMIRKICKLMPFFLFFLVFSCTIGDFNSVSEVTIHYYYNKSDGSVASRSFTQVVKKDSYLGGGPITWSNDLWSQSDDPEVSFGYIGDGKIGKEGVKYLYSANNNVWYFHSYMQPNIKWNTSSAIEHSLSLEPEYTSTEDGEEKITLYFKYNIPSSTTNGFSEVTEPVEFSLSEVEKGAVSFQMIESGNKALNIFSSSPDSDCGLGYVDKSYYNKIYYYGKNYKNIYEYKSIDGSNLYTSNSLITKSMDNSVFTLNYINGGFVNIKGEDEKGGITGLEQVFIPGTIRSDGTRASFPYTIAGSMRDGILVNPDLWFIADTPEKQRTASAPADPG